jgi:cytoskeletal protein CcmA (bactofilin family)
MAKDEINAFLGSGTSYTGKLNFQGSVRIDGNFTGEVESKGTLVIGKDAHVEGEIKVAQMVISGNINGEIEATEKVVLHKTANMIGSLKTPVLVIEEGAVIEGQITMGAKSKAKPGSKTEDASKIPSFFSRSKGEGAPPKTDQAGDGKGPEAVASAAKKP